MLPSLRRPYRQRRPSAILLELEATGRALETAVLEREWNQVLGKSPSWSGCGSRRPLPAQQLVLALLSPWLQRIPRGERLLLGEMTLN